MAKNNKFDDFKKLSSHLFCIPVTLICFVTRSCWGIWSHLVIALVCIPEGHSFCCARLSSQWQFNVCLWVRLWVHLDSCLSGFIWTITFILWMDFKVIWHNCSPWWVDVPFEGFIRVGKRSRSHVLDKLSLDNLLEVLVPIKFGQDVYISNIRD